MSYKENRINKIEKYEQELEIDVVLLLAKIKRERQIIEGITKTRPYFGIDTKFIRKKMIDEDINNNKLAEILSMSSSCLSSKLSGRADFSSDEVALLYDMFGKKIFVSKKNS